MLRLVKISCLAAGSLAVVGVVVAALALTNSLPRRGGAAQLAGLAAGVDIEFDAFAIPRIRGQSVADVFAAQGFLHAQERYFQMDLTRRSVAGELADIFGSRASALDRNQLPFEFRRRARETLAALPAAHRAWLAAYTDGVNAGLADLGARPPEYWLINREPTAWKIEDSVLVVFAIYTMLSNNEYYERAQAVMAATLPEALFAFLTPSSARQDRPLQSTFEDPTGGYRPAPIPPADIIDLRDSPADRVPTGIVDPPMMGQAASNQWAIDAGRSNRNVAILANDPHLGLSLPNLFYRAELYWPGVTVRGVSVPGLPGILIGANEHIAWGATVSYVDQSDWVVLEVDPNDHERYLTADGYEKFSTTLVQSTAGENAPWEYSTTRWGPVIADDGQGRALALKATWLEPEGLNLNLFELMMAKSLDDGLRVIDRWSGPALSWSLAGTDGAVAWMMNGPIPERTGFDGSTPVSWADGSRRWTGYQARPRVTGESSGVVFNANSRPLPMPAANALSRMWMRSHRAERIATLLAGSVSLDEDDLFRMQLDTKAAAYEPIRELILEVVASDAADPALAAARRHALDWNGSADHAGPEFLTLQRLFLALLGRVLAPLLGPAVAADPGFVYRWPLAEEAMLRILEERPAHLLSSEYADWDSFLRAIVRDAMSTDDENFDRPWGLANRLNVGHALRGLPLLGRLLQLPAEPQSGSTVSLRVATPRRGAVFRMVVAPAAPERGILQMLGGQSGHFLSANFIDQHYDWAADVPTAFLAGATVTSIRLEPQDR